MEYYFAPDILRRQATEYRNDIGQKLALWARGKLITATRHREAKERRSG